MSGEGSPLELGTEEMRRLGYRVIDLLVDRLAGLEDEAVWRTASRAEMEARLREPAPEDGRGAETALERLCADVLPYSEHTDHPRFMAYIPGSPTWPAILGAAVAAGANVFSGTWLAAPGSAQVELLVLDWFKEWLGYPEGAAGVLTSGGSEANLTAIACARATRFGPANPDAVVYVSAQSHASVERALRVLGFAPSRVRTIPTDPAYRLRLDALGAAVDADVADGLAPFVVAANAGATSTGAVDPLPELADLCAARGLWLHVDAAYGGFAALCERGRRELDGLGRADSITIDPHKWLYQPWGTGCLLVRDGRLLERAFGVFADYLQDAVAGEAEVNFADRGIQLTRPARAFSIWLSVQAHGLAAFRRAVERTIELGERAQARIEATDALELLSPASLGIVCFRRRVDGDESQAARVNAEIAANLNAGGFAYLSSTRLDGRYTLRLCLAGHRTRASDVDAVLDRIAAG